MQYIMTILGEIETLSVSKQLIRRYNFFMNYNLYQNAHNIVFFIIASLQDFSIGTLDIDQYEDRQIDR